MSKLTVNEIEPVSPGTGIGIGAPNTHNSAIMNVQSPAATQGASPYPPMNTAQRNAIPGPFPGLGIFNTDTGGVEVYDGVVWETKGIKSINGQINQAQIINTGSSGTAPNVTQSGTDTNTINIPQASSPAVTAGLISKADYDYFTQKLNPEKNVLRVVKNAILGSQDYGTINAALTAAGLIASSSNMVIVKVGPGIYVEPQLNVPPFVYVVGDSMDPVIVRPLTSSQHIFSLSANSGLSFMFLQNAPSGFAALFCNDAGDFTIAHKVTMNNCDIGVWCRSATVDCFNYLEYVDTTGGSIGIKIESNGTVSYVNAENFYVYSSDPGNVNPADGALVTGVAAQFICHAAGFEGSNSLGNAVRVNNGAFVDMKAVSFRYWLNGLNAENVGAGCEINVTGANYLHNVHDFNIAHPSTTGTINATASEENSVFDIGTVGNLSLLITDTDGDIVTSGSQKARQPDGGFTDVTTLLSGTAPMGILVNGDINPPPSGLTATVEAGLGYLQKSDGSTKKITWPDTPITVPANSTGYLFFDQFGTLQFNVSKPNPTQNIIMGRVETNATGFEIIEESGFRSTHAANAIGEALRRGIGAVFSSGAITTEVGTRNLAVTAGSYYYGELNFLSNGASPITFIAYYGNGSGGFVHVTGQTVVDNAFYDNGTGTLAPISAGNYVKHAIYALGDSTNDFDSEAYFLVYGQQQFTSLTLAEQGNLPIPPGFLDEAVVLIASVIVQQGTTHVVEIRDERPVVGFKASGIAATTFHSGLLGLTVGDDHPQYWRGDGTHTATGDFNLGTHNITNVGTVNSVVVENHHARHQPGGADAIPTAAPSADLTANTTNTEGISTSIARSDHGHAIDTGVPVTQSPDQTNNAGSSPNLAKADHIHNIPTAAPVTSLSSTTTNSQGVAATFAKSDHGHAILTGNPSTQTPNQANNAGSSPNLAKADHVHNIPTAAPITQNADQANAQGSATSFAQSDHIHNIPTATPTDIGSANAQGSATTFVKSDHVHKGLHSIKANTGTQRFGDTSLKNGVGTTVSDDGSGNFTVDTNFGANEFAVTSTSGLTINYSGGRFVNGLNGTVFNVPSGSSTVSPSTTGYLYVSLNTLGNTPTVTTSTTPPPFDSLPFASFVSGVSTVTTTDIRSFVNIAPLGNILRVTYPGSGLSVNYNAGRVSINGVITNIADGSITLTASVAAGAIYVDPSTNVVTANTTGIFPPNSIPLALYTTSGTAVTALSGQRVFLRSNIVFGAASDIAQLTPDLAAAAGSTNKYAMADHVHNVPTATATTISSNANVQGSNASFARSNHTHQLTATAALLDHQPQYDGSNWQVAYPESALQSSRATRKQDDFISPGSGAFIGELTWLTAVSGSGSTVALSNAVVSNNHPGTVALTAGSAATRSAGITWGVSPNMFILGGGTMNIEMDINIPTLATVTNDYSIRVGLGDSALVDFTNGVYFEYTRATSTNWLMKTANGGTRTSTATATAVATGWTRLTIQINAAASSVTYLINGTSVGTVTTNIPSAATGFAMHIVTAAGGPNLFYVDYFSMNQRFTTPR